MCGRLQRKDRNIEELIIKFALSRANYVRVFFKFYTKTSNKLIICTVQMISHYLWISKSLRTKDKTVNEVTSLKVASNLCPSLLFIYFFFFFIFLFLPGCVGLDLVCFDSTNSVSGLLILSNDDLTFFLFINFQNQ